MKKSEIRGVMSSLAELDLGDKEVLSFIKSLADNQRYTSDRAYNIFCQNCAIYYTGSIIAVSRKIKQGVDVSEWEDRLICEVERRSLIRY